MTSQTKILQENYVTISETSLLLGVSYVAVQRYVQRGSLPSLLVEGRRWIPKAAIAKRFEDLLANPATRGAVVNRLRNLSEIIGVDFDIEELRAPQTDRQAQMVTVG